MSVPSPLLAAFLILAFHAAAPVALPAGIERVTSVEGITEYSPAEWAARAAFPRSVAPDRDGEYHLQSRVAA